MSRDETPDHLTPEVVLNILEIVQEDEAIVVGGQSVNLWAIHYEQKVPDLAEYAPFTSKDIDFFRNQKAAERLAEALGGEIKIPDADEITPSAALVVGNLKNRHIVVDFMREIKGVETSSISDNYITLVGENPTTGEEIKIPVLHPLDCVRSRLANINMLKRTDDLSVRQARVSIIVLEKFLNDILDQGLYQHAQDTLNDLAYVVKDKHQGKISHLDDEIALTPEVVLKFFLDHDGLDYRWREKILAPAFSRCVDNLSRAHQRLSEKYKLGKVAQQVRRRSLAECSPMRADR